MQWVETDTSTNGNRWRLENSLGIYVSLAVLSIETGDDFDGYRVRIHDTKYYLDGMPLEAARDHVQSDLRQCLRDLIQEL